MNPKSILFVSLAYFGIATGYAFSQETLVLRTIPLPPSSSLVIKRITEPLAPASGNASSPPGFTRLNMPKVKETYVVTFQSANSEVDLEREEFISAPKSTDSTMPRFAVYDAAREGDKLHYLLSKQGKVYLAVATISDSGGVSMYRQIPVSDTFSAIEDAHFLKDRQGRVTLRIRKMGKKTEAFQFDSSGEAVSVPTDSSSSLPQ